MRNVAQVTKIERPVTVNKNTCYFCHAYKPFLSEKSIRLCKIMPISPQIQSDIIDGKKRETRTF